MKALLEKVEVLIPWDYLYNFHLIYTSDNIEELVYVE
jgi:hypothetical protein